MVVQFGTYEEENKRDKALCRLQNLNKVSLKDTYPLSKMDHILQKVVGSRRMSMLNDFSGYN